MELELSYVKRDKISIEMLIYEYFQERKKSVHI